MYCLSSLRYTLLFFCCRKVNGSLLYSQILQHKKLFYKHHLDATEYWVHVCCVLDSDGFSSHRIYQKVQLSVQASACGRCYVQVYTMQNESSCGLCVYAGSWRILSDWILGTALQLIVHTVSVFERFHSLSSAIYFPTQIFHTGYENGYVHSTHCVGIGYSGCSHLIALVACCYLIYLWDYLHAYASLVDSQILKIWLYCVWVYAIYIQWPIGFIFPKFHSHSLLYV